MIQKKKGGDTMPPMEKDFGIVVIMIDWHHVRQIGVNFHHELFFVLMERSTLSKITEVLSSTIPIELIGMYLLVQKMYLTHVHVLKFYSGEISQKQLEYSQQEIQLSMNM